MTNTPLTPTNTRTNRIGAVLAPPVKNTRQSKTAWSAPFSEKSLRQPQDGTAEKRRRMAMIGTQLETNLLDEPADARLTGGTRSLSRRLMGLNVATKRRATSQTVTAIGRTDVA